MQRLAVMNEDHLFLCRIPVQHFEQGQFLARDQDRFVMRLQGAPFGTDLVMIGVTTDGGGGGRGRRTSSGKQVAQ